MQSKKPTLTEQIFKGSFIVVVTSVLASPLGYGTRILLSRSLSTEAYGLFYAMLAFFSLFSSYNDLGFGKAATYYISKFLAKGDQKSIWLVAVYTAIIGLVSSVILAGFALLFNSYLADFYFKSEEAKAIIPIFALYFVFECLGLVLKNIFIGLRRAKYYSLMQPFRFLLTFFFSALLFVTHSTSLWYFSFAWMAAYAATVILFTIISAKQYAFLVGPVVYDKGLLKSLKTYALPNIASGVVHQLNSYVDTVFLTFIRGVDSVGLYNIINPIIGLPSIVLSPLTRVFFPMVSLLTEEKNGHQKITYFTETVLKIIPLITLYFNVFIFLFAQSTIATLFTYKWVALAEKPLILISVTYLFSTLVSYLSLILEGMGLLKQKVAITTFLLICNVIINPIAITFWDVKGLIVANAVLQLLATGIYLYVLSRKISFTIPYKLYLRYAVFFLLVIVTVKAVGFWPKTFGSFLITGGIYSLLVAAFALKQDLLDQQTIQIITTKVKQFKFGK